MVTDISSLLERIARLEEENAHLREQTDRLADVVAHGAELMVELEEAHARERRLEKGAEELSCQASLDAVILASTHPDELLARALDVLARCEALGATEATWRDHDGLPGRVFVPFPREGGGPAFLALACTPTPEWTARWMPLLLSFTRQISVAHAKLVAQAELTHARDRALEASRAKSAFLANMSHELRTPLNAVIGYTCLIREEIEESGAAPDVLGELDRVLKAAHHLLGVIGAVLDLSKIEAGKVDSHPTPVHVPGLLHDVRAIVEPLATENGNVFEVEVHADVGAMWLDETKLRQVLLNLVGNAIKFTRGGHVSVSAWIEGPESDRRLRIRVADTGHGIPSDQLERLFEPFVQADDSSTRVHGGSGLGLTIARAFCRLMGGDVHAASEVGSGTRFTIDLPAVPHAAT